MIIFEIIRACANEIFHMQRSIDIVTCSKRDRNDAAVVMQRNFTELKYEINASQSINASQIINTSQSLKKRVGDKVYSFIT